MDGETGGSELAEDVFAPLCNARLSTVLLIEDNEDLNDSLAERLRCSNFRVLTALDGMTGLELIHDQEPDLVVLDIGLPRLNGYKLLHRIRMEPVLADTPIVVITGSPDPDLDAKVKAWGVETVLYKPVSQRRVVRTIRDVLEQRG
jgi:DNA-binding response OmpR family regulator